MRADGAALPAKGAVACAAAAWFCGKLNVNDHFEAFNGVAGAAATGALGTLDGAVDSVGGDSQSHSLSLKLSASRFSRSGRTDMAVWLCICSTHSYETTASKCRFFIAHIAFRA